jgi:hypothetical protein
MHFRNEAKKSTQAIARLISKSGGSADYLRISKLIYLADRKSIECRGIPIVGGKYLSMEKGPTISEIMDFVAQRNAPDWKRVISPRHGNTIEVQESPSYGALSPSELEMLDSVVKVHAERSTEELVNWCHINCAEYENVPPNSRKPILVESILGATNKTPAQIEKIVKEAKALEELDALLA